MLKFYADCGIAQPDATLLAAAAMRHAWHACTAPLRQLQPIVNQCRELRQLQQPGDHSLQAPHLMMTSSGSSTSSCRAGACSSMSVDLLMAVLAGLLLA